MNLLSVIDAGNNEAHAIKPAVTIHMADPDGKLSNFKL
jgi:hypothetical protein